MYDLIIIGGGPAGVAAGVYAARKKINTLFLTKDFGGQSLVSAGIKNWIGTKEISGFEFAKSLEGHLRDQEDIEIKDNIFVSKIEKQGENFLVFTDAGDKFETKTILLTVGSRHKRLSIPGEDKYDGKGVFYCSTCDAPIMKNKITAVVGGGNSGFEAAMDLLPYANKIYILEYLEQCTADSVTCDKVRASGKSQEITMADVKEIFGGEFVEGLKYMDRRTGEMKELAVDGVFVEIGFQPNSESVKDLVDFDNHRRIIVDPRTHKTSLEGIWAAGDVTDVLYNQNNIAAGDAIKAVLNIYDYLKNI